MFCSVHRCTSMYINRNLSLAYFVLALKCPLKLKIPFHLSMSGNMFFFHFNNTKKEQIEIRKCTAFCAPASYRGQFLCQLGQILCCQIKWSFQAGTHSKTLFLMTWSSQDLPWLILDTFGKTHFFIIFEISGVIFFMIWGVQVRLNISKCMEQLQITP